ncbi:hypothetical protein HYDPIDRAFT_105860, partial [Hydnomerulius pinastri MD-312]
MSSHSSGTANLVGVHYRVGKKIGEGSFGVIFEGTNLLNSTTVAIKFEPRKAEAPQLRDECRSYRILAGCRTLLLSQSLEHHSDPNSSWDPSDLSLRAGRPP